MANWAALHGCQCLMQCTVTANGAYVQYKSVYCLSISCAHTHTGTHILRYTRTFLHRTTRRRITTCWYLNMVLASDKHCGMLLVSRTECSVAISLLPFPRLTTLSANVKCSCSGPGSQWVAFGGKLLFGLNARSHDCRPWLAMPGNSSSSRRWD